MSSTQLSNGTVFVSVSGDLDLLTAPMLGRALTTALAHGAATVAVDLSGCSFVDSTAMHTLLDARARLLERGGRLSLISPALGVRRALVAARLEEAFHVHDSRGMALGIVWDG